MSALVEAVAQAIEDAEIGYSIRLVSLIDDVSTYTLAYSDGSPVLTFDSHGAAADHVAATKRKAQAEAVIAVVLDTAEKAVAPDPNFDSETAMAECRDFDVGYQTGLRSAQTAIRKLGDHLK